MQNIAELYKKTKNRS